MKTDKHEQALDDIQRHFDEIKNDLEQNGETLDIEQLKAVLDKLTEVDIDTIKNDIENFTKQVLELNKNDITYTVDQYLDFQYNLNAENITINESNPASKVEQTLKEEIDSTEQLIQQDSAVLQALKRQHHQLNHNQNQSPNTSADPKVKRENQSVTYTAGAVVAQGGIDLIRAASKMAFDKSSNAIAGGLKAAMNSAKTTMTPSSDLSFQVRDDLQNMIDLSKDPTQHDKVREMAESVKRNVGALNRRLTLSATSLKAVSGQEPPKFAELQSAVNNVLDFAKQNEKAMMSLNAICKPNIQLSNMLNNLKLNLSELTTTLKNTMEKLKNSISDIKMG